VGFDIPFLAPNLFQARRSRLRRRFRVPGHLHDRKTAVDNNPGLLPSSASIDPRSRRFRPRRGGVPVAQAARPVFLFSGLGAEHPAMGRGLFRLSDVFRGEMERCDRLYRSLTGSPLLVRRNPPFGERMRNGRPSYVQPAVFAFQHALAAAWIAWGVRPAAVFGYSLGEDAAACVAGAASLEDVMTLVVHRAQRMDALRGGGMAVRSRDGPGHGTGSRARGSTWSLSPRSRFSSARTTQAANGSPSARSARYARTTRTT